MHTFRLSCAAFGRGKAKQYGTPLLLLPFFLPSFLPSLEASLLYVAPVLS